MLLVPLVVLGAIVVLMSIVVISNAFRVSAGERTSQFGILKSVGATKRQITSTIMYESVFLSSVGIPVGILSGLILAFCGIKIANLFLDELNALANMMMDNMSFSIDFVFSWQAFVIALFISFLSILFSAWLPARKAARSTSIDSIRKASEVKTDTKPMTTSALAQKMFGFEGVLAARSVKRSKRNYRASVLSLTISIVLFVTLSSLSSQMNIIEKSIFSNLEASVIVDYTSAQNYITHETTGREERITVAPIAGNTANAITEIFREYENVSVFGAGEDMDTYRAEVPEEMISPEMIQALSNNESQSSYDLSAEIIVVDNKNYEELCRRAKVPHGSNILLNHYSYNDNGQLVPLEPFLLTEQGFQLTKADGSLYKMPVHGTLLYKDIPEELLPLSPNIVRIVVPEWEMRGFTWYVITDDIGGFSSYANAIVNETFSQGKDSGYMSQGFRVRVFEAKDYARVMNIVVLMVMVFVYSFVVLLALIGLTNIISTMTANVRMRAKEFAVLQSIGMTHDGLKRMINIESAMCSSKSLIIGFPIAILLSYLINLPIRAMFPVPYQLPIFSMAICAIIIFLLTWATMQYSVAKLKRNNIIETIRKES